MIYFPIWGQLPML